MYACRGLRVWRYELDRGRAVMQSMQNMPLYMRLGMPLLRWRIMRDLRVQGIGRHSPEEVEDMVKKDLAAISLYLGEKLLIMATLSLYLNSIIAFVYLYSSLTNTC